jgi:hypothetical protein
LCIHVLLAAPGQTPLCVPALRNFLGYIFPVTSQPVCCQNTTSVMHIAIPEIDVMAGCQLFAASKQ